eukprot:GHVN01004856.1.p1 GENE.GHVN01004856.1~~GHVN01004856.1.p1  ORF type:complete len:616 (+),score=79.62 GHVN01004856.1:1698-3545(+)
MDSEGLFWIERNDVKGEAPAVPFHPRTPLVIDNGSYECRAGYAGADPLVFRNTLKKFVSKDKQARLSLDEAIPEMTKCGEKTAFENGVVINTEVFEKTIQNILKHLSIDDASETKVVLSSPVETPRLISAEIKEILFETYNIPALCMTADVLLGAYRSKPLETVLLVSCSHSRCMVMPVIAGKVDVENMMRIDVGGGSMHSFLQGMLELKYHDFPYHINAEDSWQLIRNCLYVSSDYANELLRFTKPEYIATNGTIVQFPPAKTKKELMEIEENISKTKRKKIENAQKMREMLFKRQKEKMKEKSMLLSLLRKKHEECIEEDERIQLAEQIDLLEEKINRKMGPKKEKPKKEMEDLFELKIRREEIKARIERSKTDIGVGGRKSAASSKRLRILAELAGEQETLEDVEESFGDKEDDWLLYQTVSGDMKALHEQVTALKEVEDAILEQEPDFLASNMDASIFELLKTGKAFPDQKETESLHKLEQQRHRIALNIEKIRTPEILFQPFMCGVDQAGLSETIHNVMKRYPPETATTLAQNIHLLGGLTGIPGLEKRITADIQGAVPREICVKVKTVSTSTLEPWHGGVALSKESAGLERSQYYEGASHQEDLYCYLK